MSKMRQFDTDPEDNETQSMELDNPEVASLDGMQDDPDRYHGVEDSPVNFVQVDIVREDADEATHTERFVDDDLMEVGTDPDIVMEDIKDFTDDEEVLDDFAERQNLGAGAGSDALLDRLREHTGQSPILSSFDVDADWERADQTGEEAAGGTVATPDQDIVEELGAALGITYRDTEPLQTEDKLDSRDQDRWELKPESSDDSELNEDKEINDELDELDELGLVDEEELDADEEELEDLVDELDDNVLAEDALEEDDDEQGYDLDDESDDIDDDFLVGGVDEEDEEY